MKKKMMMLVVVMISANVSYADIIRGIDIDFVTIGNPGNDADTTGHGIVNLEYRIGKYEITNEQWNSFVSAVGAPIGNPSNAYNQGTFFYGSKQPTTGIGWYEAAQFCNYLTSGDKSNGVYQFSGNNVNPDDYFGVDRTLAQSNYGTIYFLPTEDEWYKAAYYKPDDNGYSLYANGTNIAPTAGVQSNYSFGWDAAPWNVSDGTEEQNGTFNMMGNVWEWTETETLPAPAHRAIGGSFIEGATIIAADYPVQSVYPDYQVHHLGFRIATIPEPTTLSLLAIGALLLRRKRA